MFLIITEIYLLLFRTHVNLIHNWVYKNVGVKIHPAPTLKTNNKTSYFTTFLASINKSPQIGIFSKCP